MQTRRKKSKHATWMQYFVRTFTADTAACAVLVCASILGVSSWSRCVSWELCSSFRLSGCVRGDKRSKPFCFKTTKSIKEAKSALTIPVTGSAKHSNTHVLPSAVHTQDNICKRREDKRKYCHYYNNNNKIIIIQ